MAQDPLPDPDTFKRGMRLLKRAIVRAVLPIVGPYLGDCDIIIKKRDGKPLYIEILDRDSIEVGAT